MKNFFLTIVVTVSCSLFGMQPKPAKRYYCQECLKSNESLFKCVFNTIDEAQEHSQHNALTISSEPVSDVQHADLIIPKKKQKTRKSRTKKSSLEVLAIIANNWFPANSDDLDSSETKGKPKRTLENSVISLEENHVVDKESFQCNACGRVYRELVCFEKHKNCDRRDSSENSYTIIWSTWIDNSQRPTPNNL